jgi:hypothetical protein
MKIRLVAAELFHADRQTQRHDEAYSQSPFEILRTRTDRVMKEEAKIICNYIYYCHSNILFCY